MDQPDNRRARQPDCAARCDAVTRRSALQRGCAAIATVALAWGVAGKPSAAATLLAKATVQYTDSGAPQGMDCDDCVQFIPGRTPKDPGSCKVVEGDISPHGHCLAFSPKPKS